MRLFKSFKTVAAHAVSVGAQVYTELPRHCGYWKYTSAQRFLKRHALRQCTFDGCMHGLAAADGTHKKKPWKIVCINSTLHTELSRTCSGDHEHAQCTSKELAGTQMYTMQIADIVHRHISSGADFAPDGPRPAAKPGAGLPAAPNQPAGTARACLPCIRVHCHEKPHVPAPCTAAITTTSPQQPQTTKTGGAL